MQTTKSKCFHHRWWCSMNTPPLPLKTCWKFKNWATPNVQVTWIQKGNQQWKYQHSLNPLWFLKQHRKSSMLTEFLSSFEYIIFSTTCLWQSHRFNTKIKTWVDFFPQDFSPLSNQVSCHYSSSQDERDTTSLQRLFVLSPSQNVSVHG